MKRHAFCFRTGWLTWGGVLLTKVVPTKPKVGVAALAIPGEAVAVITGAAAGAAGAAGAMGEV
jgi:hypothetical protein